MLLHSEIVEKKLMLYSCRLLRNGNYTTNASMVNL